MRRSSFLRTFSASDDSVPASVRFDFAFACLLCFRRVGFGAPLRTCASAVAAKISASPPPRPALLLLARPGFAAFIGPFFDGVRLFFIVIVVVTIDFFFFFVVVVVFFAWLALALRCCSDEVGAGCRRAAGSGGVPRRFGGVRAAFRFGATGSG